MGLRFRKTMLKLISPQNINRGHSHNFQVMLLFRLQFVPCLKRENHYLTSALTKIRKGYIYRKRWI
jgi:hypothetical protein